MPRKSIYQSKFNQGDIIIMPSGLGYSVTATYDPLRRQATSLAANPYWLLPATKGLSGAELAGKSFQVMEIIPYDSSVQDSRHVLLLQEAKAGTHWEAMPNKRGMYARIHLLHDAEVVGRIGQRAIRLLPAEHAVRPKTSARFKGAATRRL